VLEQTFIFFNKAHYGNKLN